MSDLNCFYRSSVYCTFGTDQISWRGFRHIVYSTVHFWALCWGNKRKRATIVGHHIRGENSLIKSLARSFLPSVWLAEAVNSAINTARRKFELKNQIRERARFNRMRSIPLDPHKPAFLFLAWKRPQWTIVTKSNWAFDRSRRARPRLCESFGWERHKCLKMPDNKEQLCQPSHWLPNTCSKKGCHSSQGD